MQYWQTRWIKHGASTKVLRVQKFVIIFKFSRQENFRNVFSQTDYLPHIFPLKRLSGDNQVVCQIPSIYSFSKRLFSIYFASFTIQHSKTAAIRHYPQSFEVALHSILFNQYLKKESSFRMFRVHSKKKKHTLLNSIGARKIFCRRNHGGISGSRNGRICENLISCWLSVVDWLLCRAQLVELVLCEWVVWAMFAVCCLMDSGAFNFDVVAFYLNFLKFHDALLNVWEYAFCFNLMVCSVQSCHVPQKFLLFEPLFGLQETLENNAGQL